MPPPSAFSGPGATQSHGRLGEGVDAVLTVGFGQCLSRTQTVFEEHDDLVGEVLIGELRDRSGLGADLREFGQGLTDGGTPARCRRGRLVELGSGQGDDPDAQTAHLRLEFRRCCGHGLMIVLIERCSGGTSDDAQASPTQTVMVS